MKNILFWIWLKIKPDIVLLSDARCFFNTFYLPVMPAQISGRCILPKSRFTFIKSVNIQNSLLRQCVPYNQSTFDFFFFLIWLIEVFMYLKGLNLMNWYDFAALAWSQEESMPSNSWRGSNHPIFGREILRSRSVPISWRNYPIPVFSASEARCAAGQAACDSRFGCWTRCFVITM